MNPKEKNDEIIELTDEELDEIFADDSSPISFAVEVSVASTKPEVFRLYPRLRQATR